MQLHGAYQQRAAEAGAIPQHQRALAAAAGLCLVTAVADDLRLEALVNPRTHVVEQAAFAGAEAVVDRGLLETLCVIIEGKPIQECADHAAIFAERALRDPAAPPLVSGLLTPDNGDHAFKFLQNMVRELRRRYAEQTGFSDTTNFFDRRASAQWRKLTEAARLDLLNQALQKQQLSEHLRILGIQEARRVVVAFTATLNSLDQQLMLVRLENILQQTVEPTLQIMLEIKSDTNVVRMPTVKKPS